MIADERLIIQADGIPMSGGINDLTLHYKRFR